MTQEENNCDRDISHPRRVLPVTGHDTHLVHKEIVNTIKKNINLIISSPYVSLSKAQLRSWKNSIQV